MDNITSLLPPALRAHLIALIYRNTRTSCLSLAALCSWVSHDSLNRLLHAGFPWSGRLWELLASRLVKAGDYPVLNDTTWERWDKHAEAVARVWSSSAGHLTQVMQVVLLIWADGHWKMPVGIRLWRKGEQSKVELALEILRETTQRGLQPNYVLFDSWYASRAILNLLEELKWNYVARIKSNRLLNGKAIGREWQCFGQASGNLKRVDHRVRTLKAGRRFFVTNDLESQPAQIKRPRQRRQIEETIRLSKQEFGWGGASVRKAKAQETHLHLGLIAMCLAQHAAYQRQQSVYAFKRDSFCQSIPEQLPFGKTF